MPDDLRPSRPLPRALVELPTAVPGTAAAGPLDGVTVTGCTHDSHRVQSGDLYAALPGAHAHGADFAAEAVAAGAVAVLTDPEGARRDLGVPVVVADDPRALLARVASWVHGDPAADLCLLGVTGTNGKTTTAFLMEAGLRGAGLRTGLIGTVATRVGEAVLPKHWITNPEATDLHALLALMRERAVTAVAMEVSSHALAVGRVDGLRFRAAAFTNFSQDHLELHATMEDYFAAKASLFTPERAEHGIVNAEDPACRRLLAEPAIPTSSFSTAGPADWRAEDVRLSPDGSEFRLVGPGTSVPVSLRLPGAFNVSNAVAALACLVTSGVDAEAAAGGIAALPGVPGRMERVDAGQAFTAIVDYAHTPEAVRTLLQAVRRITTGRVIVVLGCGGDRDPSKRPLMGQAAVHGADVAVLTSDNPRSEDPMAILEAMRQPGAHVEPDRAAAIRWAVGQARPGDAVVVAGKGHETGQEIAGEVLPFDDGEVLRAALHDLGGGR